MVMKLTLPLIPDDTARRIKRQWASGGRSVAGSPYENIELSIQQVMYHLIIVPLVHCLVGESAAKVSLDPSMAEFYVILKIIYFSITQLLQ